MLEYPTFPESPYFFHPDGSMCNKPPGFDYLTQNIISYYPNLVSTVVADSMLMAKNTGTQSCWFCKNHVNEIP